MDGYVLRRIKEATYLGLDNYGQDWMDYLSDWNGLNPACKIEIDAFIDCHFSGNVTHFLKYNQWLNKTTGNNYFMLYYSTSDWDNNFPLPGQNFSFIGYDIVCLKEPQHLEEIFYSSLLNEIGLIDRFLKQENNTLRFVGKLNQYALFGDLFVAREFLLIRNRYYEKYSNHLFETAFGTNYEIVRIYLRDI